VRLTSASFKPLFPDRYTAVYHLLFLLCHLLLKFGYCDTGCRKSSSHLIVFSVVMSDVVPGCDEQRLGIKQVLLWKCQSNVICKFVPQRCIPCFPVKSNLVLLNDAQRLNCNVNIIHILSLSKKALSRSVSSVSKHVRECRTYHRRISRIYNRLG
jgi:hypothetical protein